MEQMDGYFFAAEPSSVKIKVNSKFLWGIKMPFICRIDKRNTHAWQVRGPGKRGYHSRLFSDQKHGGREEALAAARAYLEELQASLGPTAQPSPYPFRYHTGRRLSSNKSGITGVYRSHSYTGAGLKQEFWGAYVSIGPYGRKYLKRFYITDNRDEEEAFRLAVEFRQMWEEAAQQGEAAIRQFFREYEDGWL